jgi:hypothetical protein
MSPSAEVVADVSLGDGSAGSLAPVVSVGDALVGDAVVGDALVGDAADGEGDVGADDGVGLRCETRVLGDAEVPPGAHAVRSPIASVPPATSAAVRTLITGAV